jgi:hypothetical protein
MIWKYQVGLSGEDCMIWKYQVGFTGGLGDAGAPIGATNCLRRPGCYTRYNQVDHLQKPRSPLSSISKNFNSREQRAATPK